MSLKILLVDDDNQLRSSIARSLKAKDYEVIEAENGKVALGLLEFEKVNLVLSDVKMPVLNGIEFLHRCKKEFSDIPFIMMTGFSEIIEIKEAYEIGANGFLAKPYSEKDLFFQIDRVLNPEKNEKKDKANYLGIHIEEFVAGASIKFPIHIQVEEGKFVKIANEGENLTNKQIEEFKDKETNFFYLKQEDFVEYINFNFKIKHSILRSPNLPDEKKLKFIKILCNHLNKYLTLVDVDESVLEMVEELRLDQATLLKKNPKLIKELLNIKSEFEKEIDLYTFAAIIGDFLFDQLEWQTEDNRKELFFGNLLQDISMKFKVKDINKETPLESCKKIEELQLFDKTFQEMILHHKEKLDGSGFPSGLKGGRINPLANLIGLSFSIAMLLTIEVDVDLKEGLEMIKQSAQFRGEYLERVDSLFFS